jgi:hypothetical protein
MPDEQYSRENAFAYCAECKGPIFHGEPVFWYSNVEGGTNFVHRFKNYCEHYKKQEQSFVDALGIEDPKL